MLYISKIILALIISEYLIIGLISIKYLFYEILEIIADFTQRKCNIDFTQGIKTSIEAFRSEENVDQSDD